GLEMERSMRCRTAALLMCVLGLLGSGILACEPAIGDECETNLDCPAGSICDTTAPGGYCLISNCEDGGDCPDGSLCVVFDRFTRFCMASCDGNGDCRSDYECRKDLDPRGFCYVPQGDDLPFSRPMSQ